MHIPNRNCVESYILNGHNQAQCVSAEVHGNRWYQRENELPFECSEPECHIKISSTGTQTTEHPGEERITMQRLPRTSLTLSYISGLSKTVRRVLRPLDIKVVLRPLCTLCHQLVSPKYTVPMYQRAGVVHQIPCSDCPKVYIGQSGRSLKHRLSEHRWVLQNGDVATSALAEHMVHWPPCGPIPGWSRWYPTLCGHTVSPRKLTHPTPPRHLESWKGDSAQRVYSTLGLAFDNLHTLLIVFYC